MNRYENENSAVEEYFGNCPSCARSNGCRSVGPVHWYVCHTHRTKWNVGANLFSGWKYLPEAEHLANARLLSDYVEVKPIKPRWLLRLLFQMLGWRRRYLPTKDEREERKQLWDG